MSKALFWGEDDHLLDLKAIHFFFDLHSDEIEFRLENFIRKCDTHKKIY